jgi:hypothetical protein
MTHLSDDRGYNGPEHRRLVVFNVDKPSKKLRVLPKTPLARTIQQQIDAMHQSAFDTDWDDSAVKTGTEVAIDQFPSPGCGHDAPTRTYDVPVPSGASVIQATVSPQGDRVVYLLDFDRVAPIARLLARLLPAGRLPHYREAGIWTSRLDGSRMREVGHIRVPADVDWADGPLTDLEWLPDEKHLSFAYQNALWTVAAQ